jgi:hypothetical protein
MATVYSFSQPNDWVYEPVGPHMTYWNDPFHFSLAMGRGMLGALAGKPVDGLPDDFMIRMTPDAAAGHVAERREAVRAWAERNPDYVTAFATERARYEQSLAGTD